MILASLVWVCVEEVIRFPRKEVAENKDMLTLVVPSEIKRGTSSY